MAGEDWKTELPKEFLVKMERLLGEEYARFAESYNEQKLQGLRVNPLKVRSAEGRRKLIEKFGLQKIPWAADGYYYEGETRPGRHPWHEAGAFYIQEPSAMAAAEFLAAEPGERVLDLCAAPGGKTTQIAGQLQGQGLLVSNEIHPARAKILSQNVERMGIRNAVVTNEAPKILAERFPGFFDRIAVDAPCSGEGMFRKDEDARGQWSPENVIRCAARQAEILDQGAIMLRPGGRMVYSTCTFSPEENEGSISGFLRRHPDFSVEETAACEDFGRGKPEWTEGGQEELNRTYRIWPHHVRGEGHYLAVLRKNEDAPGRIRKLSRPSYVKDREIKRIWREFCLDTFTDEGTELFDGEMQERMVLFGEQLYLIPEEMPDYAGLRVLRPGLHLGTVKKKRFEPSHGLALYLQEQQVKRWETREAQSREMAAYLRGETLEASGEGGNGWTLMAADGFSTGWAKKVGTVLKNHYPKGLRRG